MPVFQTRVVEAKMSFSPFSASSMEGIANILLDHIRTRIQSAQDMTDSHAAPLKERYAREKVEGRYVALGGPKKYYGLPQRDWTLRGRTLSACRVKSVSQERATIGPTSAETGKIMGIRNRWDKMWGVSPTDGQALQAAVLATLRKVASIRVERGTRKAA